MENFISTENKSFVWQLLLENKAFKNIHNSKFNTIKNLFEKNFDLVSQLENNNLIEKNKIVISKIMTDISYFKTQNISTPLQEVKIEIDNALKHKEEEFIKLIKKPTPAEINFTDQNFEGSNISGLIDILAYTYHTLMFYLNHP